MPELHQRTTGARRRSRALNGNGAATVTTRPNARTRQEYAMLIREEWREVGAGWRQSVKGILNTGTCLKEANEELDADEFEAMLSEDDLGFTAPTARKLILIAANQTLCAHVHKLPPHWGHLYELSKADDARLLAAIEDDTVHPEMSRQEAMDLVPARRSTTSSDNSSEAEPARADTNRPGNRWSHHNAGSGASNVHKVIEAIEAVFGQPPLRQLLEGAKDYSPENRAMVVDALGEKIIAIAVGYRDDLATIDVVSP
jgi:hypothetical protein